MEIKKFVNSLRWEYDRRDSVNLALTVAFVAAFLGGMFVGFFAALVVGTATVRFASPIAASMGIGAMLAICTPFPAAVSARVARWLFVHQLVLGVVAGLLGYLVAQAICT